MTADPPLRRDALERRRRLVDAAIAVFTEEGITVPLERVAERANVGRATLYRNFPDRTALLLAVFAKGLERLRRRVEPLAAERDGFFSMLDALADFAIRAAPLTDALRRGGLTPDQRESLHGDLKILFAPFIARAHAEGLIRPDLTVEDAPLITRLIGESLAMAPGEGRHARGLALLIGGLRNPNGR